MEQFGSLMEAPEEPDKKSKSRKKSAESIGSLFERDVKKEQAGEDIAKTLDLSSLFGKKANKFEADKLPTSELADAQSLPERPKEANKPYELSAAESQHVASSIAKEHLADLEATPTEDPEVLSPARQFLEQVQAGEDIESAFAEASADLPIEDSLEAPPPEDSEPLEEQPDAAEELSEDIEINLADESKEDDDGDDGSGGSGGGAGSGGGGLGSGGSGGSSGTGGSGGTGGGAGAPGGPGGPGPAGPGGPGGHGPGGPGVPGGPHNPNNPNQPQQNPNAQPQQPNVYIIRRHNLQDALLGGLVGYLIGRRRGRIKTEKKLLPVQRSFEKQVANLQENMARKEQQLVDAKVRQRQKESLAPLPVAKPEIAQTRRAQIVENMPPRPESRLHLEKPKAERLAKIAVAAEAPRIIEKKTIETRQGKIVGQPEQVRTMHRAELMDVAQKIMVEGASLKQIYETRLIGEHQLRFLVSEFLQGKDIRNDLRKEMIEHEIDFERDPIMRDRVRSMVQSSGAGSGLSQLLASAGALPAEAAPKEERFDPWKTPHPQDVQDEKDRRDDKAANMALGIAIGVLLIVIGWLLLH